MCKAEAHKRNWNSQTSQASKCNWMLWRHWDWRILVPDHGIRKRWRPLRLHCWQGKDLWIRSKQNLLSNKQWDRILASEWHLPQRYETRKRSAWQWEQNQDCGFWFLTKIQRDWDFRDILWISVIHRTRVGFNDRVLRTLDRHLELWHHPLCNDHRWIAIWPRK